MRATKLSLLLVGCFIAGLALTADPPPAHAAAKVCGDTECHPSEACPACPECCICGDGTCNGAESCSTCSADCGTCEPGCGDLICDATLSENCATCSTDCGECVGYTELTDFATCPKTLLDCDDTTNSCCKRPFGSFNGRLPLIIPTDRCHQPIANDGDKYSIPNLDAPMWCSNPGSPDPDIILPDSTVLPGTGMIEAYGLVYRAMQAGIPVYWAINPTKDPQAINEAQPNIAAQTYSNRDVDLWILSPDDDDGIPPAIGEGLTSCVGTCRSPIVRLDSSLNPVETYDMKEFPLRGGAFIIAGADRDEFDALFTSTGDYTANAGSFYYDFSAVDIYEVQDGAAFVYQDFRPVEGPYPRIYGAPIAVTMDSKPPRLAVQDGGPAELWLGRARLNQPADTGCETGDTFSPSDAVYCVMSNTAIENNQLITGGFSWAWLHAPGLSCDAMDELSDFMTAVEGVKDGNHIMFMEAALETSESCSTGRFLGDPTTGMGMVDPAGAAPYILRYPANIIAQVGDVPAGFAQGSPSKWDWLGSIKYQSNHYDYAGGGTLVRLVSEDASSDCSSPLNRSTTSCDVFAPGGGDNIDFVAYIRHENNAANGVAFYAAGNNVNPRSTTAHLRMTLNAFLALPTGLVDSTDDPDLDDDYIEVTRSAPVIVEGGVQTMYQGTFGKFNPPEEAPDVSVFTDASDASQFRFPHTPGHFRLFDIDAGGTELIDVSDDGMIPEGTIGGCSSTFSATCRTIFTNTDSGLRPERKFFVDTSAADTALQAALGGSIAFDSADAEALMRRVLAGWPDGFGGTKPMLGGVDRSTVAVIGVSPLAEGASERPQIAYFGGLDGGLHAVCTEGDRAPCEYVGQELWMYIPRTQLPNLRLNTQRVDGSPNVTELFGDFDGDGTREWRTILIFQTGDGESNIPSVAPVIVALDITDPGDPIILWDIDTAGLGMTLATGPVRVAGVTKSYTFAAMNRGNEPDSGIVMTAIDVETGEQVWTQNKLYGDRGEGNPKPPASGIPSGTAAVDMDATGIITDVAVTTLFGEMWLLDASDGTSVYGADPLFRFTEDYHPIGVPPVLYRRAENGRPHAIVASGGYADPFETAWAPDTVEQWVVGVWLESPVGLISEDTVTDFGENRAFTLNLGAGNRVFAQPVVVGDNIFIVTDSTDINLDSFGFSDVNTGSIVSYSLSGLADGTATPTTTSIAAGGGGVDVAGSGVAVGGNAGGDTATITAAPADYNPDGDSMERPFFTSGTGRQVWLRLQ